MKLLNVPQGSPAWHAARASHFCASEAPAMLGVSKYMTRTELLTLKKTGIAAEVDPAKQRLFDAGHQAEAAARPIAEAIIGQELYPVVGTREINGLPLLASLDGQIMDETIIWENKLYNESLAQACAAGELEPHYWAQLEHQLIVSQADTALFTTSDGTPERTAQTWYKSVPERRQQVLQGWTQFAIDLESYVPEVIGAAPVGRTPETLPALHIEVTGMVTASNLAQYKEHALSVFKSVNRELKTDQDFADARKAVKWCGEVEDRLQAAKQHALSQTESIDALFRTIDDITEEARRVRLELNNLVKTRDTTLRAEIVTGGQTALAEHIAQCNQRIGRPLMPTIPADFATAIKGMSKFDNMRAAVSTELARAKISANEWADKITLNLKAIHEQDQFAFLFADASVLALKDPEFVAMAIKNRVADHQAAEAARVEAERARIAEEERIKAEAAAKARADAEIAAATAAAQAEAARASAEAIAKAQARQHEELEQSEPTRQADLNNIMVVANATINEVCGVPPVRETMKKEAHTPGYVPHFAPAAPELKLGQICTRLGFQVTADFLKSLGFEPAGRERAAVLFHETDFPRICSALIQHVQRVRNGVAA